LYLVGRKTISVTEYTFRLLLALIRNIVHIDYLLKYTNELTRVDYEDKMGVRTITSEWYIDSKVPFFYIVDLYCIRKNRYNWV
jgi:lactate dehydrogenase-like 2-hydroxyacid dehydrogenase